MSTSLDPLSVIVLSDGAPCVVALDVALSRQTHPTRGLRRKTGSSCVGSSTVLDEPNMLVRRILPNVRLI